ncbi:MAG: hypothetical protein WCT20_01345 [Candidatus Babeliales bacterium]
MTIFNRIRVNILSLVLHSCLIGLLGAQDPADGASVAKPNLYRAIAEENLKSISEVKKEKRGDIDYDNFDFDAYLKEQFNKLLHPDPAVRRRSMFTLLSTFEENNQLPRTDVLDHVTWLDLELLCGQKSNPHLYLAAQLDRTVTEAGKVALYRKVVSPTSDVQQLRNQQAITIHLLSNEKLFNELDTTLKALVESENLMLSFWYGDYLSRWEVEQDKVKIPFQLSSKVTALKDLEHFMNTSPAAWEARNAEGRVFGLIPKAMLLYWLVAAPTFYLLGHDISNDLPDSIKGWVPNAKVLTQFKGFAIFSTIGIMAFLTSQMFAQRENGQDEWKRWREFSEGGFTMYGQSREIYWQLYDILHMFHPEGDRDEYYYAKVVHVARYTNNLKAMAQLVTSDQEFLQLMPSVKAFNESVAKLGKTSQDLQLLLELLEKKTFDGKYSKLMYWGRVKVAFTLIADLKTQFVDMMVMLGEIDAQLSIAKLYKEFKDKGVTFCFPYYIDPLSVEKPAVLARDFWNPLIDADKVVPSSLEVGQLWVKPQNVIITGPNAGGKSTITKAFITAIIVAQSLGIAPAKTLTLTPFNKITTYLNITDDIASGKSHFRAGVLRAREVQKMFNDLKPHEFGLTAIDEVFNGTTHAEGQAAAYSLIKLLGKNPLGMCITNTHFKIIPSLEQSTGNFLNYKVSVIDRPGEKIQYPFKLERGVSDQNVAFKILREEGLGDELLDVAQQVLDGSLEQVLSVAKD